MKCPICNSHKELKRTTEFAPIRVGKRQFTVEVNVDKCSCGEIFVHGRSAIAAEKLVAAHLAKHGHMDVEIFKFMRKALGLTAGALGKKLSVSETTISRWENGKNDIPQTAAAVLSLMAMNDEAIPVTDVLDLLSSPRKLTFNKLKHGQPAKPKRSSAAMAQELATQLLAEEQAGFDT